jgi:hypothetical protein
MNTESITTRKVESGGMERPGDFSFDEDFSHLYVWLPGMPGPDAIPIQRGEQGGYRVWGWDGNTEAPTLTPSISVPGYWHGYLRAGKLESC